MPTIRADAAQIDWTPGSIFYGPDAVHEGRELVELKILSDRRGQGGGIAWIVRFRPPPGKLIKIVAIARSEEHVFPLSGGRATKHGAPVGFTGGYALNTTGQPHSAFIAEETESLVVYSGEPDEICEMSVVSAERVA